MMSPSVMTGWTPDTATLTQVPSRVLLPNGKEIDP
jgi:hypothetical protein